jgi:hypothetical protein
MSSLHSGHTPPWSGLVGGMSARQCLHLTAAALTSSLQNGHAPISAFASGITMLLPAREVSPPRWYGSGRPAA